MCHAMVQILKLLSETFPTIVPLYNTVLVKQQLHQSIIHEEPEPAKFLCGTSKNLERSGKFLEYFLLETRNESVKEPRAWEPKPHVNEDNTVNFH